MTWSTALALREAMTALKGQVVVITGASSGLGTAAMERYNENYVGGDINGGAATLTQLFTRPVARLDPYTTPVPHLFPALRRRHQAAAFTACAATGPQRVRCEGSLADLRERIGTNPAMGSVEVLWNRETIC